ncbi:hypothetical protein Drorol1_Dr00003546 [Drosera rotundifolia]
MALSMTHTSLTITFFGIISFIFGVIAENKKPAAGTPIPGRDVVICQYPSSPYVALGYLSVIFLVLSTAVGYFSLFYPYKKKSIPYSALFNTKLMVIFFNIAWLTSGLALVLLLWPTIQEQVHLSKKVHHNLEYDCPTAKTGLIGGGAFVSLDACLIWLICLMLASNAREDYFDEVEESLKGEFSEVINIDYHHGQHPAPRV